TRFSRDWSSDVCSSDLVSPKPTLISDKNGLYSSSLSKPFAQDMPAMMIGFFDSFSYKSFKPQDTPKEASLSKNKFWPSCINKSRSEERRVGKECRSKWA